LYSKGFKTSAPNEKLDGRLLIKREAAEKRGGESRTKKRRYKKRDMEDGGM